MEKICTDCMFVVYCYDEELENYAEAMNLDGTCDSFITNEEFNERVPCELGDYFMFNDELLQVNAIRYCKEKGVDDFWVYVQNIGRDMECILASQCTFLTKEEAEKKLEELK